MFKAKKILLNFLLAGMLIFGINCISSYAQEGGLQADPEASMVQEESATTGILQGSPVEISADISLYSKYLWRGFTLDTDPVLQPGVYISAYGFTASVWGSFDIDSDDESNSDEMDYSIAYDEDLSLN